MFHALVCAALSTLPQIPAPAPTPAALEVRGVATVLQADDSWFVAENRSHSEQVLFVGSLEDGLVPPVRLSPGMRMAWPCPYGVAQSLFVELLLLDATGWRNSGAFPVAQLRSLEDGTAWVTSDEPALSVWAHVGAELTQLAPVGEILPTTLLEVGARTLVDFADDGDQPAFPTHVPVIVPGGGETPSKPPKIEKKPLPPV